MSLAERLQAPPKKRGSCRVAELLDDLSGPELAAFEQALASRDWPQDSLVAALNDEGHEMTGYAIGSHRRRSCACYRAAA